MQMSLKEHNVELDITEEDLEDLKRGTVDMYTFSYYMSNNVTTTLMLKKWQETSQLVPKPHLTYLDWGQHMTQ